MLLSSEGAVNASPAPTESGRALPHSKTWPSSRTHSWRLRFGVRRRSAAFQTGSLHNRRKIISSQKPERGLLSLFDLRSKTSLNRYPTAGRGTVILVIMALTNVALQAALDISPAD